MFKGFSESETFSRLPDGFFHDLLREIGDVEELKVTLYALWRLEHIVGPFRALCETDFEGEDLGLNPAQIHSGLQKAAGRGSLLKAEHGADIFYFLNTPRGRAAAQAFAQGKWRDSAGISSAPLERPNTFRLYEENIGPLTPLIADAIKDAEQMFSEVWVADAIEVAVKNNKRNWKYCEAVLKRWKEEGRGKKQARRDDQANRRRNVEERIKKFVDG